MSQTLQSVLCITTNKYLVRVLVVLLHACFSVVSPIPFLLAAIFFSGHPYIGSTTVLPDYVYLDHDVNHDLSPNNWIMEGCPGPSGTCQLAPISTH